MSEKLDLEPLDLEPVEETQPSAELDLEPLDLEEIPEEPGMLSKAAGHVGDVVSGTVEKVTAIPGQMYDVGKTLVNAATSPTHESYSKQVTDQEIESEAARMKRDEPGAPELQMKNSRELLRERLASRKAAPDRAEVFTKNAAEGMSILDIPPELKAEAEKQIGRYKDVFTGDRSITDMFSGDPKGYEGKSSEDIAAANEKRDAEMDEKFPGAMVTGKLSGATALAGPAIAATGAPIASMATMGAVQGTSQKYNETGDIVESVKEGIENAATVPLTEGAVRLTGKALQSGKAITDKRAQLSEMLKRKSQESSAGQIITNEKKQAGFAARDGKTGATREQEIGQTLKDEGITSSLNPLKNHKDKLVEIIKKKKAAGQELDDSLKELDDAINNANLPDENITPSIKTTAPGPQKEVILNKQELPGSKSASAEVVHESIDTRPFAQTGKYKRRFDDVEELAPDLVDQGIPGVKGEVLPENIDGTFRQVETAITELEPRVIQVDQFRKSTVGRVDPKQVAAEYRQSISKDPLSGASGVDPHVERVLKLLENSGPMSLEKANDLIRGIDKLSGFGKQNLPAQAEQFQGLRKVFNSRADQAAEQAAQATGKMETFQKFQKNNRVYGDLKDAYKNSSSTGPREASLPKALEFIPGAQSVGNYVKRTAPRSLERLSRMVKSEPGRLGKWADKLGKATERGSKSLAATSYIISQQDPEYRKFLEELDKEEENSIRE